MGRSCLTIRFTEIDESNIGIHPRLTPADKCLFLFEYTSGKRYDFSSTNNLISTLKRKPGQKGAYYKNQAIDRCAGYLREALNPEWLANATLVPAPPSKAVGHPEYDDRIERICRQIRPGQDVRCIVRQSASMQAAHEAGACRPSVDELLAIYEIDETKAEPAPRHMAIVDDMLTAGTHFRALEIKLHERFPDVPIVGLFIARRVFPEIEFPDLDDF